MNKEEDEILQEIGAVSTKVVKQDSAAKEAIASEREAKRHFLALMVDEVREALPAICSKAVVDGAGVQPPHDRGVMLAKKRGAVLFLDEKGNFFVVVYQGPEWVGLLSMDEVVEQRWDVREMAENLADELQANLAGKLKVVARAEEMASKVRAVSTLMGSR